MARVGECLEELFQAERTTRRLHQELSLAPRADLVEELRLATRTALELPDAEEAGVRLYRLANLLGELDGGDVVDLLIDILGSPSPEARVAAGESLEGLAFDRWKEVATGIERAVGRLKKGSPALTELPFLLAEVGEPGCVKLLGRFLKHEDPEAVAAAIEALAELADPSAIPLLEPLEKDARQVQLDEESGENERVAIGDLAHEARELLEELADATDEGYPGKAAAPPPGKAGHPGKKDKKKGR